MHLQSETLSLVSGRVFSGSTTGTTRFNSVEPCGSNCPFLGPIFFYEVSGLSIQCSELIALSWAMESRCSASRYQKIRSIPSGLVHIWIQNEMKNYNHWSESQTFLKACRTERQVVNSKEVLPVELMLHEDPQSISSVLPRNRHMNPLPITNWCHWYFVSVVYSWIKNRCLSAVERVIGFGNDGNMPICEIGAGAQPEAQLKVEVWLDFVRK